MADAATINIRLMRLYYNLNYHLLGVVLIYSESISAAAMPYCRMLKFFQVYKNIFFFTSFSTPIKFFLCTSGNLLTADNIDLKNNKITTSVPKF